MKLSSLLYAAPAMVLLCQATTSAQQLYQVVITGTSSTTDNTGKIVSRTSNNQTLLQEFAKNQGATDISFLALAYHMKAAGDSAVGDTIDVINRTNGTYYATLIGFYFGEDPALGRTQLLSGSNRQQRRIEYIYTSQNSHSMGSALITNYYWFDTQGHTNNVMAFGTMQWIANPDAVSTNTRVYTTSFTTVKPLKFQ
jgi:hypothetical protein